MKNWEAIATCNSCGVKKVKRKDEYNPSTYLCISCFRINRGKELGEKFGKKQLKQGACLSCKEPIASQLKWCKKEECIAVKKKTFSERMIGVNNPVWTGNSVCSCGNKKTTDAKKCRNCSFKDGQRSGVNNGKYVKLNRELFLARQKSKSVARNILSNYLKAKGLKKEFKSEKILGYSFEEFKAHIDSQLEPWMDWGNYGLGKGKWNVDHIVPLSYLSNMGVTEPRVVNALCNLRPMCSIANIVKSNKLTDNHNDILNKMLTLNKEKQMHKIEIRKRSDANGNISTGANTEILIDGKVLEGVLEVDIHIGAKDIATVDIKMMGEVSVDLDINGNPYVSDMEDIVLIPENKNAKT